MEAGGTDIIEFLKANPESYFSRKEISKKAVHKSIYEENPNWVTQPLHSLLNDGQVEQNDSGHYRLKQVGYVSKAKKY